MRNVDVDVNDDDAIAKISKPEYLNVHLSKVAHYTWDKKTIFVQKLFNSGPFLVYFTQ